MRLKSLLADNAGLQVTPRILLHFVAEKMRESPPRNAISNNYMPLLPMRGQGEARDGYSRYRRSSGSESIRTSSQSSLASLRGPHTPNEGQDKEKDGYSCYYRSLSNETNRTSYERRHSSPDDNNGTFNAKRCLSKGLPSPIAIHNTHDTSLPIHNVDSASPPNPLCDLYQYLGALHSRPPPPSPPKRCCSSLSPPFRQHEKLCGRQLSRSQPRILSIPRVSKGGHLSPLPSTPVDISLGTASSPHDIPSISPPALSHNLNQHPASLHPRDFHQYSVSLLSNPSMPSFPKRRSSSLPPTPHQPDNFLSQAAPMVENGSCVVVLTPNMYTLSLPSKPFQSSPNMRDEQIQTDLSLSPDVLTVDKKGQPLSTMMLQTLGINGFKKSPMAQLLYEYSSVSIQSQLGPMETSIRLVLSLEDLTPDLIVDRGEVRARSLPRYHLVKVTMDNLTTVVTAQQIFLQQAAALIVDRKLHFIVDPGNTLIPILQGTSSLPQMYTVWRALITRIKLGVKAWEKYIAEYQLQVGPAALPSLST